MDQIVLRIRPMESVGLRPLLEIIYLTTIAWRSHGMEQYGLLEVLQQIVLRIHPTELHGVNLLLEIMCFHQVFMRLHGMEHDGSLELLEQINLDIRLTESNGLRPLLERNFLQASVGHSHQKLYYLI
jgi:hypothetical protein